MKSEKWQPIEIEVSEYDSLSIDICNLECLIEQEKRIGWAEPEDFTRMYKELEALKAKRDLLPKPSIIPYKVIASYGVVLLIVGIFSWAVTSQYTVIVKTHTYEKTLANGEVVTRSEKYLYDEWFGTTSYVRITKYGKRIRGTYTAFDRFMDLFFKTLCFLLFLRFGYLILKHNRIEDGSEQPIGKLIFNDIKQAVIDDAKKGMERAKAIVTRDKKH